MSNRMISVGFRGKPFNIMVIQVYVLTSNAEEVEIAESYGKLQGFLELTPQKDVLCIIRDWNAKVRSQEIPGVTGKFGLGVQNEAGQRLIEFCQENTLVIANTLFQQYKRRLHMDMCSLLKCKCLLHSSISLILKVTFFDIYPKLATLKKSEFCQGMPHTLQSLRQFRQSIRKLQQSGNQQQRDSQRDDECFSSPHVREDQMVNAEIRLIIFFAAKDGEAL